MSATHTASKLSVVVEIAPGELIDKITVLRIKRRRISDPQKVANVVLELTLLERAMHDQVVGVLPFDSLVNELEAVNQELWDIEDAIRVCERKQQFDARFVELARSVYRTNDRRAELKRALNDLLGAKIIEEKNYEKY